MKKLEETHFTHHERNKEAKKRQQENFNHFPAKRRKGIGLSEGKRNIETMTDTTMESIASLERENDELHRIRQLLTDQY